MLDKLLLIARAPLSALVLPESIPLLIEDATAAICVATVSAMAAKVVEKVCLMEASTVSTLVLIWSSVVLIVVFALFQAVVIEEHDDTAVSRLPPITLAGLQRWDLFVRIGAQLCGSILPVRGINFRKPTDSI